MLIAARIERVIDSLAVHCAVDLLQTPIELLALKARPHMFREQVMSSEPNIGGSNNGLEKVLSSSPEPIEISPPTSHHGNALHHSRTLSSSLSSSSSSRITERPPPFSRKLTRALFIRPADTRGPAPGHLESIKSALTYSWVNVLFVFNPIAWALHYTHQTDGAVFAMALLGVIPLAGMLGHGTETIALYTGDALGGEFFFSFATVVRTHKKLSRSH